MKTKPTTRVSFSDNPPTVNITMPTCWQGLSQDELRTVFRCLDEYPSPDNCVAFQIFRRLVRMKILRRGDDNRFLCSFKAGVGRKAKKYNIWLTAEQLVEYVECLNFISDPGNVPVRLDVIGSGSRRKYSAVNPQLHNVCFRDYVKIENLYQGFLRTNDMSDITKLAALLYPGFNPDKDTLLPYETLSILHWLIQVKAMFALTFKNFFSPAGGNGETPSMMEVLNNEIRALTQGDVTKEAEILEIDCWRALTELDFKAKEAEEFNRAKSKHK